MDRDIYDYAVSGTTETHVYEHAGGDDSHAVADHPRHNHLLAALPEQDLARLLPNLELVPLPAGWIVHRAGGRIQHGYFPISGVISPCHVTRDGTSAAFAIAGREAMVGIPLLMGVDSAPSEAAVHCEGQAYRINASTLKHEFARGGELQNVLLRYTQALFTQMAQTALCNQSHSIEQRLSRWLLSSLDRMGGNELHMTQCMLAQVLGVRRESVTDVAGSFQQSGLIHYHRGDIEVLDREGLEHKACDCYDEIKKEFSRLLPARALN